MAAAPAADPFSSDYHRRRLQLGAELTAAHPTLCIQPLSLHALALHTRLRDERTQTAAFVAAADCLLSQLVSLALSVLPVECVSVTTPTAESFVGCALSRSVCGVSIVRAGESMEAALRALVPSCSIGKLLIQRDESKADKPAVFFYAKLPQHIAHTEVMLLDPMLASGGSAICAMQHLLSRGVSLDRITFVNLISSPEGLTALFSAFPSLRVVSGMLDPRIDERKYIRPGVGDFGDRYFGTVEGALQEQEAAAAAPTAASK